MRLIFLHLFPKRINNALALRCSLPQGELVHIVVVIEVEALNSEERGLEFVKKRSAGMGGFADRIDHRANELERCEEVTEKSNPTDMAPHKPSEPLPCLLEIFYMNMLAIEVEKLSQSTESAAPFIKCSFHCLSFQCAH